MGKPKDTATDEAIRALTEELEGLGIAPTHDRVATVLSVERGERVTGNAIRLRRRYNARVSK